MPTDKKTRLYKASQTMKRYSAEADMEMEKTMGLKQEIHNKAADRAQKVNKIYKRVLARADAAGAKKPTAKKK